MNDVTRILSAIEQGDPQAADHSWPLVYDELRRLVTRKFASKHQPSSGSTRGREVHVRARARAGS
jgi:hypothetical protein